MEQNKVLMIIASAAIFFVAVFGVGVALLYPGGGAESEGTRHSAVREFDPIEYVRRQERAPLEPPEKEDSLIIVYGEREDHDPLSQAPAVDGELHLEEDPPAPAPAAPAPAADPRPAPTASAPRASAPAEPAPRAEPRPAPARPAPAESPEPRQVRVTEYWIQLIASPSRDRVAQAEQTLASRDLGGRVTTRNVDGQIFYRLRVGPYKSKAEAEQFLQWVRAIEGFEEAYISEEYPLRSVSS
ncbi:Sporulation related domain-containing protein [Alkalispirochaeta americana]|uniref:Sporulation related domain-containing protein n=1 Tax=Alkalispirochaeta americana TaxID=159291 RepID=A0A1N6TDY4_9SPIO|nr:SPOR domain-containing protein [Alkalispirochaeta americana]SIQ51457.1 Sporulation related domain-containing protein [Alkalispirochaeta americana]